MMNKKLVNILFTIICIAITVWLVCDFYKGLAINPTIPNWIFYLKIGITIIIYVFTYKAVLVSANNSQHVKFNHCLVWQCQPLVFI